MRVATAARQRLGQPELFEAKRQIQRLSGSVAYKGKRPEVRAKEYGFSNYIILKTIWNNFALISKI
jgi:hypothetical protein